MLSGALLYGLSKKDADIIYRVYITQQPPREVAALYKISRATLYRRIKRARETILENAENEPLY